MDVGEAAVGAVVAEREAFVIQTEQVQDRGVDVVGGDLVPGGLPGPRIAFAVGDAGAIRGASAATASSAE